MMLIEVLVTIAIMTIIAAIATFAVVRIKNEQDKKVARLSASTLRRTVSAWRLDHRGEPCPSFAQLRAEKFVDRQSSPRDPWGTNYVIECADDDVTIKSRGPDRAPDTPDDIVVPSDDDGV
jgi:type II secretory pathway pseudopilin PulG